MERKLIIVTGGAGHVGSHVAEMLATDAENRVVSLDNYFNGTRANHVSGVEYRYGHTKNIGRLIPETPAIVYHLGEYARISTSKDDIADVYDMNIGGTFAVAEFCRSRNVRKLVYAGSSTKFAIGEIGRDKDPYAFSKATNADLIVNYGKWYDLPYAICYFYNGFGPRERGDGKYATLIAKFERLYLERQPLTVTGDGSQKRYFTWVKDLARGIIVAGERGLGDGYAFGATAAHTVREIAEAFGGPVVTIPGEPGRMDATNDPTRALQLGWEPTVDIMKYIEEFVRSHPR